jgi:uncharacterized protein (TIGR02118 family)
MYKFMIMFRQPADTSEFDGIFTDFLALVERMPLIQRRQMVHVNGSPQGTPPYYRGLEIYFASEAAMREALLSQAGQEAGNELGRFQNGLFDVYFAEVYEEAGGSTPG